MDFTLLLKQRHDMKPNLFGHFCPTNHADVAMLDADHPYGDLPLWPDLEPPEHSKKLISKRLVPTVMMLNKISKSFGLPYIVLY